MENHRVLIVDDDKDIAEFFRLALSLLGYECKIVLSAKDALAQLASSLPDLILLDMRLGSDIGGEDILYQIRSNPRFDESRIVVITAYPRIAEMVSSLADLVLIKPVEVEQLTTLVTRLGAHEAGSKQSLFRDPITQLFNRDFFNTRLELAFDRVHRRSDFLFAVTVIQVLLEGLETKALDAEAWVTIQQELSARLYRNLRPMDAIAKFSEWRFAALYEELKKPDDVKIILARLREVLAEPIQCRGQTFQLVVCFGTTVYNGNIQHPQGILESAETELGKALKQHSSISPIS